MNNDYRLQLLSHSEIFTTKEDAMEYIEDNFKGVALWGEPALFFYGTEREPKMILAVGASHDTRKPRICVIDDAELRELIQKVKDATDKNTEDIAKTAERILNIVDSVGLTLDENKIKGQISYEPDRSDELIGEAQTVAEAIAIISTFVQKKFAEMELTVEDGESIDFTFNKTDDGSTLTGEVKISAEGSDDDLFFNNNIVGIKPDGIFASCNIEFDAERNQLIFTTSGVKNGRFVTDANKKIIDFGAHTIYVADNENHNVAVTINQERGTISADVKISSDDDNLLVSKDGKMYVSGRAKDIKYKNTTVAAKLTAIDEAVADILDKIQVLTIEDLIQGDESDSIITRAIKNQNGGYTLTADVRLSTDDSIQIGNGGIRANIDIDVDTSNNKLVLKVGNTEKAVTLPGISILDNIYYDSVNKCIVITWKDGTQQTVIPVADMLKTWVVVNNPTNAVTLTKSEASTAGQPDTLSADVKISPTDNLLGKDSNGQLYVKASDIDNKIAVEASARQSADAALNAVIDNEVQNRQAADDELSSAINEEATTRHEQDDILKDSINAAREEAANALEAKATEIYARIDTDEDKINQAFADAAEAKSLVELTNANLEAEISRATTAEGVNADAIANETTRATAAENAISTRVTTLETGLASERDTRTTADAVHDEQISNIRDAMASSEASHQQDVERLSNSIRDNADAIAVINGSENVPGSIRETVKAAKDELNVNINNEKTRAESKETELAEQISAETVRATAAESAALANAKDYTDNAVSVASTAANVYTDNAKAEAVEISEAYADGKIAEAIVSVKEYTDHSIADSKHLSDDYTDAAKAEAIQTAKDYTDSKINGSYSDSKEYTDNAVAAEKARAEAAETANANEIVSLKAKDLELEGELANKVESVTVVKNSQNDLQYILKVDGVDAGEINIPKDQFLQSVTYNPVSKEIVFTFETTSGVETTTISVADLVDTYIAGNGLVLDGNTFSVKINPASEFISVDANGIKVSGINAALDSKANVGDSYTKAESDAKYITEHQDLSSLNSRITTNENAIAIINGNEAQAGSIKKALKDANEYTDQKVEIEKNAREAVDALKANASDVYTKVEADNKFLTDHQDISHLATKNELTAETARAEAAETANANEITGLKAKDTQIEGELANKIEDVAIVKGDTDLIYRLIVDGEEKGVINIPKDQFLKNVTYNPATKEITFVFDTNEGEKTVVISVADLVDTYTAGNGLKLVNNQFSIVINEDSESYLTLTAEGLKISGIDAALATKANATDVYTKAESDARYLTEHQDISNLATKTEVNDAVAALNAKDTEIEAKSDANTAKLEILNGNESQEGSVKKALNDAKGYADSAVLVEKNRAEDAETANANAIAVINGNESQTGSIKKALADAKAYTDSEIATEKNRAEAAENVISDAVSIINGNEAQAGSINKALKDAKDYADTLVADERTARQTSDNEINAAIDNKANKSEVYTKAEIEAKGYLTNTDISNLATKDEVSAENARAVAAEATLTNGLSAANANISSNASDISALKTEAARLNLIVDETDSIKLIKSKDDNGTELAANVKLDGSTTNIIKITGNGLTADVEMSYSQASNTIIFSNGIVTQEFQLAGASLIEDGFYDSTTKQIVLVTRLADGSTREIRINADALIHTLKVDNGTQNPIKLYKTTDTDGVDVLSARLDISTEAHNLILNNNGTLYASNEAKNMTGLWGGEEKSLQWIISQIEGASGSIDTIEGDVADLKNDMTTAKRDISSLQSELTTVSNKVTQNTVDIATNRGSIETLTTQVSDINSKVTNLTNKVEELTETVQGYEGRVTTLETDMTNVKSNVSTLINDVNTLKTQLGDISGLKTVAERLVAIEEIVNNLIDFDTY